MLETIQEKIKTIEGIKSLTKEQLFYADKWLTDGKLELDSIELLVEFSFQMVVNF